MAAESALSSASEAVVGPVGCSKVGCVDASLSFRPTLPEELGAVVADATVVVMVVVVVEAVVVVVEAVSVAVGRGGAVAAAVWDCFVECACSSAVPPSCSLAVLVSERKPVIWNAPGLARRRPRVAGISTD